MMTPIEEIYAKARVVGLTPEMSAIAAGFDYGLASMKAGELEESEEIQNYIQRFVAVKIEEYKIIDKLDPKEFLEQKLNDPAVNPETKISIAFKLLPYTSKRERNAQGSSKTTKKEQQQQALEDAEGGPFASGTPPTTPLRAVK